MDRRVTPPKQVASPSWGPPFPCKQALNYQYMIIQMKVAVWWYFSMVLLIML